MRIRLQDLPDINTWTTQRSIAYAERTAEQVEACVFSVLKDLRRLGDSNDEIKQTCGDILCLLETMPIYFYDPEKKCLSTVPFPKNKLVFPFPVPIDFTHDVQNIDDMYTTQLLGELYDDFDTYRMERITGGKMKLSDALYIMHRGNTETVLWFALVNRLRRQGITTLDKTEDLSSKIMMGSLAHSIQSIVQLHFIIKDHKVPGHSDQYVMMGLNQTIEMVEPSMLDFTLFAAMNRPLTSPDILVPYLDPKSVAYHFIPKDTFK